MKERLDKDYQQYRAADFALDPSFIKWVKNPGGDESDFWVNWCDSHPEKQTEIEKGRTLVLTLQFGHKRTSSSDVAGEWETLQKGLKSGRSFTGKKGGPGSGFFFRIAAMLLLAVSFTFALGRLGFVSPDQPGSAMIRKEALKGQKLTVALPDGSVVKLNAESSIEYLMDFSGEVREVALEGEAFFEVVHNPLKPFRVRAGDVTTMVVGTSFNVKSYPESSTVQVALATGSVQVSGIHTATGAGGPVLKPGEMLTVSSGESLISEYDREYILGWKDGLLSFDRVSFGDALKTMERWYGVAFEVDENVRIDPDWRFHGKFENKPLTYILRAMSYPRLFEFRINHNKVLITNLK